MKGDYSRFTFRKEKHYSGVRMQQGRVQLDADWNEQHDINTHLDRTTRVDTFGLSGGPQENAGFKIVSKDFKLHLTPGRYYVNGILCENEGSVPLSNQPDLPDTPLPEKCCLYTAYLDVWTRNVTALEESHIREKALLGTDTTTRARTVWQVKFEEMDANDVEGAPLPGSGWKPTGNAGASLLGARARRFDVENDPCSHVLGTGYHRLDNHLYRIEIHDSGTAGKATYKWSRDNACRVARLIRVENRVVTISDHGRGAEFEFQPKQWIEISDEGRALRGEPGVMAEIEKVDGFNLTVAEWPGNNGKDYCPFYFGEKPTVRIWDRDENRDSGPVSGVHLVREKEWMTLESGIEIRFEKNGNYRSGDYWMIPARVATGDIEWPHDENLRPVMCPPDGIEHSYAPIAILKHAGDWEPLEDLRSLFPPITKITELFYVGGDGQDIIRDERLTNSLKVGVSNGQLPLANALVRFEIGFPARKDKGAGWLSIFPKADGGEYSVVCRTNKKGEAECYWWPDPDVKNQVVTATLLDHACEPVHIPIRFTASITGAQEVTYSPYRGNILKGIDNVGDALDRLNRLKAEDIAYIASSEGSENITKTVQNVLEELQKGTGVSGGGLASIIAELANAVCVQDDRKRHKAIIEIPVKPDSSILYSTLGLVLNLVRIAYATVLEFLDIQKAGKIDGKNYLGDSASINLDAFFGSFGLPALQKMINEKRESLNGLGQMFPNLLLYTIAEILGDRIFGSNRNSEENARAFFSLLQEYGEKFGDLENFNGIAAYNFFMTAFYLPIMDSRKFDHKATSILIKLILDITAACWKRLSTGILIDKDMKFDIPNDIDWNNKMEKPVRAIFHSLGNYGLVRIDDNPPVQLIDTLVQRPVTGGFGATWLIYRNKACRISHKELIDATENDLLKTPGPDLTINPLNGWQFEEAEFSGSYFLLYSLSPSGVKNILSIPVSYLNTLSGAHDLKTILDADTPGTGGTINADITVSSRIKIVRGRTDAPPAALFLENEPYFMNLESNEITDCAFSEQGITIQLENIHGAYTANLADAGGVSEFTIVIYDDLNGQRLLLGQADNGYIKWLSKVKLHSFSRIADVASDQLIINHDLNEPSWAFVPLSTFLPGLWSDHAALYKGMLNSVASDSKPHFEVDFLGNIYTDTGGSASSLKFETGSISDAHFNDSLITVLKWNTFLKIYKTDGEILPSYLNSIILQHPRVSYSTLQQYHNRIQFVHCRSGKYFIVLKADNSIQETKVLEMSTIERGA
ncbi:MAG: DUF6519 domain-containing protein [Nitrospinota bacterium]|nr:DUF6519 domain-containing protein [Nitrospinota bacterium]